MTDNLDFALSHRSFEKPEAELYSVDFQVNGISLLSATKAKERNLAGCFMSLAVAGHNEKLARIFKGELLADELPDNRIPLFVCPICGDPGCGTIAFKLTRHETLVRWSQFAYEYGWDETLADFESYSKLGPFEFDFEPYKLVIDRAVAIISR